MLACLLAATGSAPRSEPTDAAGAPEPVERTFACPGGLPGAQMLSGLDGRRVIASAPRDLVAPAAQSASAFAAQTATGRTWLAYANCPEPRTLWWFVGAGASTRHGSQLTLANPRAGDAVVDVEVLGADGLVQAPGLRGIAVASGSSEVLNLAEVAPANGDLAVRVIATQGRIAASMADGWSATGVEGQVRDWVAGQPAAAARQVLTGFPQRPDAVTLLLANPGAVEVIARVRGVGDEGTFAPEDNAEVTVPPRSVREVPATELFTEQPMAVAVVSERRLALGARVLRGADIAYAPVGTVLSGRALMAVPADVAGVVTISAGEQSGRLRLVQRRADGRESGDAITVEVDAEASVSVSLAAGTRLVELTDPTPGLVAGLGVTSAAGLGAAGFTPTTALGRTPVVVPGG